MASDGPGDFQNAVNISGTAGLGFRVKSGWAAVVLLTNTVDVPRVSDIGRIDLCDPRHPETRQPYHAATGKLETDSTKISQRECVVRDISRQALTKLIKCYKKKGFQIQRAALVVGSRIDPVTIGNPHIRAHALEGRLFRTVLEEGLHVHDIRTELLLERDAYSSVAARLDQSTDDLRHIIQNLGRSQAAIDCSWRAEQKLAALAALLVLG